MMMTLIPALLWFCALGCGLLAGLYFAFSVFIMTALNRLGPTAGAAAMNSINNQILRSLFMPLFLLTSLASLALAVIGAVRWRQPVAWLLVAGGITYVVGMFVVTMIFNVPLNNRLLASRGAEVDAMWHHYLVRWTRWNHVRTLASLAASALFVAALIRLA
jgi:uncharacterized membrane protein